MAVRFSSISAIEILDSRGRPTLSVTATLPDGTRVRSGVPAGASTGTREAIELRDGDDERYAGQGVRRAVGNVNGPIADALIGRLFASLDEVDQTLRELDGTADKSRLGANAIVGVSMAAAQAFARQSGQPLWQWLTPTGALGDRVQLVGDDNFVTNPELITAAVSAGVANAALIKVNQIGTVSETLDALAVCREAGYGAMISHRSGETSDSFIADLAVGSGCGQIKSGAPARGERVAKYNRLLEIATAAPEMPFGLPDH